MEKIEIDPLKFDNGKSEYHLIPSLALEEISKAFTYGAKKYGEYNWANGQGIQKGRYFSACLRHLWAFWRRKENDDESKVSHLAHAGACLLILLEMHLLNKGLDNRPDYYRNDDDND